MIAGLDHDLAAVQFADLVFELIERFVVGRFKVRVSVFERGNPVPLRSRMLAGAFHRDPILIAAVIGTVKSIPQFPAGIYLSVVPIWTAFSDFLAHHPPIMIFAGIALIFLLGKFLKPR